MATTRSPRPRKYLPVTEFAPGPELPSQLPPVHGWVAWDTETSQLHPDDDPSGRAISVVSVAYRDQAGQPHSAAFPFAQGPDEAKTSAPNLPLNEWLSLTEWLTNAGLGLTGHNTKFDLLHAWRGVMSPVNYPGVDLAAARGARQIFDTALGAKELWPLASVKLKDIGVELWGEQTADDQSALKPYLGPMKQRRFDRVPWEVMQPYATTDAELALMLFEYVQEAAEEGQISVPFLNREHDVMLALLRMEQLGLPYPAQDSRGVASELRQRLANQTAQMPYKPAEAKKYYFGDQPVTNSVGLITPALNRPPLETTPKTGQPKFTAEIVDRMVDLNWPWAAELAAVKKATTAESMWYTGYADKTGSDGRLRTTFRQVASARGDSGGTASGRFSVERVNLQAIPHDYRLTGDLLKGLPTPRALIGEAIAKTGMLGWELDLAQAELRVAASYARCKGMLQALENGVDLHSQTAQQLFNLTPDDPTWYQFRTVAKRANFSGIFGVGAVTFQAFVRREARLDLSFKESERIIMDWRALYPEYQVALDHWQSVADRNRRIPLANGRYRYYRWGEDTRSGFNQRVQGSLAEMNKEWLMATDQLMSQAKLPPGAGLLLSIHDSMVLLLPDTDYGRLLVDLVAKAGETAWNKVFPEIGGAVDVAPWKS